MNLDSVTITGPDDSTPWQALYDLSAEFPFVEWGILVSESRAGVSEGTPRFPSWNWIDKLRNGAPRDPKLFQLSLHVCGSWVRRLLVGENHLPIGLADRFRRVQLNFHAERTRCYPIAFQYALSEWTPSQFIFQIDGATGNKHLESVYEHNEADASVDAVPLFDVSGGAGIVPREWPKPTYFSNPLDPVYHGYAGGLGPDNIVLELERIAVAAGNTRIWIDMETRVRTEDNLRLDLDKVRRVLTLCAPLIQRSEETMK